MKTRKSKLKSFFAMLLVVTTVCQQSSLTVLATDDTYEVMDQTEVADTSEGLEAYEQGAETVDASSEENASELETVVTDIPAEVTDVPAENPITETPAEPTETPVTEVPAEPTEAPVTEVPAEPTEVPVTEAPAEPTEAPTPETSPTVAPETTSVPQSEETKVSKTSFTYEDNRVVITATAPEEANLPQDAELKADYLQPGSETYNAAVAAFNSQLANELGLTAENRTAEYVLYDVYFLTADGSRIEPESGHVKVDMTFKQIQESTVDGEVVNKDVVHLKNDGVAEVVTEYVNTNAEGEVTSMGFSQDSFSISGSAVTLTTESDKKENVVTSVSLSFREKGEIASNEIDSIPSGKEGFLFASIGFANNDDHIVTSTVEINLGQTNAKFLDFSNNVYKANGVTYTLITDESGNKKIKVEGLTANGSAQMLRLRVEFPEGTSSSKDDIHADLLVDGNSKIQATLQCKAEPKWHHKKTADYVSIGTTGTTTDFKMKNDLVFTLNEYSDEIHEGNLWLDGFKITDTMRFPAGMYIDKADAAAAISLTGMEGATITSVYDSADSNKVIGYDITYTKQSGDKTKQLPDWNGKVTVKKENIKFAENYEDGKVTNELQTVVSPIDGSTDNTLTEKAEATVLVKKPGEVDFEDDNANNKSIKHVSTKKPGHWSDNNRWGAYVIVGDYILYAVNAKNNGDTTTDITIEDDLDKVNPRGSLVFATEEELASLKDTDWELGWGENKPSQVVWCENRNSGENATAQISGNKATWTFKNVAPNESVTGYVVMKVAQNENQQITNEITINGDKATKTNTVDQKKDEEKMEVTKTASAEPIVDGKEVYTVTIKNSGSATASGWKFSDVLPEGMELDGTIDGSAFVNGNVTYDAATGKIEGELSDIEAGKTVTLTIPVKLKENTTEIVFRNVAQVIKGEHTVEGEVTVHKNSRDFAVIKTADRTLADSEDLVKYTLTVRNNGSYSSVLTEEEPLLFWDVPEGVTIEEEKQSDEFIQSKPNGVIITREFEKDDQGKVTRVVFKASGKFNAGETASVNVWATMPKVTSGAVSVKNTAGTGENPPTSETETVVEPKQGDSEETKVVYGADGKPLPDPGVVSEGDILTYKITITNTGESNITEVYGQDTLVNKDGSGSTTHYAIDENGNNSGTLILTVEKADGVTGIKVGDCVTINNKWGIKDFSFLITSNDATKKCADTILKNSDFSIAPRGTLTLSYRLKLLDNFKDAYNQVSINGHEPVTSVEYAVVDGKFDVYKYAGGTYASDGSKKYDLDNGNKSYSLNPDDYSSAEDLQNKLVIPYAVVVKNLSTNNGEETFDNFTVMDTLPDGLEWVKYDQNNDVIVAAGNSGSTNSSWETDTNSWDNVKVSVSGNTITTTFTKAKQAWNNQQAYLLIFYKARLTIDKATEIYNKLKDSKDSLVLETFKNTATLKATKPFINSEGKIGTETSDSDDFTVEENTTHVSFEKAAEGCYAGGSDHDYNGELTTVGGTAGSKIVWKLVINNDSKGNGGAPLINYSILDTLPSGYQYQKSEDGEYPNTMIVYKKDGSKNREIPFVEPTIDNTAGTIAWDFNTEVKPEFKLEPGEYLEIKYATCVKSADDSRDGIFTNYAKLTVHGYTEPGTTPGKDDFEKEYEDSASYTLSSVATSSVKTIAYNRHEEHKKDPKNDTGRGDHPMPGNYVQGMQGEDVTYTLNVKNEASATTIANMVVIDRLPYINDIGVVAGYGRGSAFEVYYDGGLAVSVDGTAVEGVTTLFSSDDHTIIGDGAGEWSTKDANNTVEWHEGYQAGDRLIRFQFPEDFKLPAGKTVTIQFNGKVPDYVENTGEGNIAWNSFAYSYTDQGETSGILIAEPAKVGVWVKTPESGKITVNKTFKSAGTNRTFYFAVFTKNEQDEYVRFSSVKSLSLTGAADGTNGTVVFDHLPYDSEKETVYYVFETDAQGNILTSDQEGKVTIDGVNFTVTGQGQDVTLADGVKERTVSLVNEEEQLISIEGEKVWDDAGNEGARPETITVRLKANGEEVAHQEVTKGNGWKWKFENFPEYEAGQKIAYTVTEDAVENYVASEITGTYNIKNTYNPGKTSITVQKIWSDGDNQDGKRPTGIEVELYQNGTATGKKVTLNEENHWKHIWTDLDEKANGQKITYSVKETGESGGKVSFSGAEYTVTYSDEVAGTLTVTNSHTPSMISIEGEKVWDDAGNEGARPEMITVRLKANGEEVAHQEVTKDNNWKWKFENFPEYEAGQKITYTVTEDPVDGYITTAVEGKYDIVNTPTTVIVDKLDDNKETVVGATLQIRKEGEEEIVETWITDGNSHNITGKLVAGTTYVLEENNVPAGYVAADSITFTVEADGSITVGGEKVDGNKLTLIDKRIHFNVNKVELGSGNEVEGAELTVLDKEGNVIDSWISRKGETHDFGDKLKTDTEYILRETVAPDGYKYATDIEFKVEKDGTITTTAKCTEDENGNKTYLVEDDTTKVKITKTDDVTGKALAGATLQIVDASGQVVEEWITDGTPHMVTGKLTLGATYSLVEKEAPAGYEIAESITFKVDSDDEKNAIEMKDAMTKSPTAVIAVTKDLKLNNDLVNAVDKTFYVALFADQECTKLASDVKAIEFKNASSSTVEFTGLDLGRTYYVKEVDKDGKGIEVGTTEDGKTFIPYYPEGQEATVKEDGGRTLLLFENQFTEWPDGFYKEIRLNITKRLIGADGKEKASDEVFYAGIFDDKELTALTSRTTQNIVELNLAGDSTTSVRVDGMVQPGESFNLYVAEVDKNGKPVADAEEFGYRVTVSGDGAVSFDENNPEASVTITNQELPEATPTVTPEETPTVTPTPTTSTGVKTGDDTPIGFYMVLLFAAAIVMEEAARRRRRNTQK